jgi:hypothetical protein
MDGRTTQAPHHGRRRLANQLGLDLLLGGAMTGLLALGGAALIEANPANDPGSALYCTAFQVGSPRSASTRIQLYNAGPERAGVRLDFVDHDGRDSQTIGYSPILDPSESGEFAFRTPPLGAAVKLVTPGRNLQATVELHFEDGALPEIRTSIPCLPGASPQGNRSDAGGPLGAAPSGPGRGAD